MPFNRPSLPAIIERIVSDIESRLPGADARLRRSNLAVLARAEAGVAHGLYGYIDFFARQVIIDTADAEYLERWASVWGIGRTSASPATGNVTMTGNSGTVIPAGMTLQRSDGAQFTTTAAVTIAAGTATVPVIASDAGLPGNTLAGTRLTLAAQTFGVSATATVTVDGLVGGTDIEGDDSLRDRLLFRIRNPPQGGAALDYDAWAREVAGVTRVWVKPQWLGAGTVGVFFVRDGDPDNIPDAGEVAIVQAYLDSKRPITAQVSALAPIPLEVDITIQVSPDTAEVRAAVTAELQDLFRREAEPSGTILVSHLREAVSLSLGEIDHVITVPGGDVVAGPGEMPVLGTITWL